MTLYSALEDLASRTLMALPGRFSRLLYLAGLRDPRGRYSHWGMNLVHGEDEVQRAAAESHGQVVADVLRTPLQHLELDALHAAQLLGDPSEKILSDMQGDPSPLLTPDAAPETQKHFSSVLMALGRLAQAKRAPIGRAS